MCAYNRVSSVFMSDLPDTPLGALLDEARRNRAQISGREVARRAGVSEGRWRAILKEGTAPMRTVVALALAVGVDPAEALNAAGTPASAEAIHAIVADLQARTRARTDAPVASGLAEEIERVERLPLPPAEKIRVAQALIKMFAEHAATPAERAEPV